MNLMSIVPRQLSPMVLRALLLCPRHGEARSLLASAASTLAIHSASAAATAFRDELHMTQVAAGVCLRTALQRWRSFADDYSHPGGGTAGLLYWQFSEPWPGPSWATTEVGR